MKVALRKTIGERLLELAKQDEKIVVVTSDARGSAAIADFSKYFQKDQ